MLERRRVPRPSTNVRGVITFGASQRLSCTVTDISSHGAGLSFGTTFGIPQVFRLQIDGEQGNRHCRVVWTNGKRLGVEFG